MHMPAVTPSDSRAHAMQCAGHSLGDILDAITKASCQQGPYTTFDVLQADTVTPGLPNIQPAESPVC